MGGMRKIHEFSDRLPAAKGVDVAHTAMSPPRRSRRAPRRGFDPRRGRHDGDPPSRSGVAPRAAQSATANPAPGTSPRARGAEPGGVRVGWALEDCRVRLYPPGQKPRVMQLEGGAQARCSTRPGGGRKPSAPSTSAASCPPVRRALQGGEVRSGRRRAAAMVAFIASAARLKKTVENVAVNGVPPRARPAAQHRRRHGAPPKRRMPSLAATGRIRTRVPELRRARSQRAAAEAKLRRALQNANGQVTTHKVRRWR